MHAPLVAPWFVALALLSSPAAAEVKLADVFGNEMVLQRDRKIAVWGEAAPGEAIEVSLADRKANTTADTQGRWRVELEPLAAGGPHELVARGTNEVKLHDVLIGEVWLCSGQSNMEWPVMDTDGGPEAVSSAKSERMRYLRVEHASSDEPQTHFVGAWRRCTPKVVEGASAVAYYFGRELEAELDVPIGLIQVTQSGAPAEPFTPRALMEKDPELGPALRRFARKKKSEPGALFNGMILPLTPFAIRGVVWYQGESNVGQAGLYRRLLPTLIGGWRAAFGQGDFPFLIVQLPSIGDPSHDCGESTWAELRDAQASTRELPNVDFAVTLDLPATSDVHPHNKQPVAHRIALLARAAVYGQKVDAFGPRMAAVAFDGPRARVTFERAEGLTKPTARPIRGFQLAGADRAWHCATARLDGVTVVVTCDEVSKPIAVRYGWADHPDLDLVDASGLPAEPFRSDDWPLTEAPAPRTSGGR
ncbi:MAG: sialate O-acetylesterase [Planctomycetes bacterium]|nr:sialate O-acetylesterase [Planctomycetota bacterium]